MQQVIRSKQESNKIAKVIKKMQAVLKKQIVIILSEEEAAWLMCNMQNPLHGQVTEDEDSYDKDMRKVLYSELKKLISGT